VEVSWLGWEEVGTETFVGVEKDSVNVVIELGGNILDEELNLVDKFASLTFGGRDLLGLFVVGFDALLNITWLNLGNVEAGSESGGRIIWGVEEIVERGGWEVLMFLLDVGEDDWGHADFALEGGLLGVLLIRDFLAESGGKLGRADESHDVRVVLEDEHLLVEGGLVVSGRSNLDNGALSQVWEFELEGKSVEGLARGISELKFVGVLIELKDLEDLSNDVKITVRFGGLGKGSNVLVINDVLGSEISIGVFLEGLKNGGILSLLGGFLTGEGIWSIAGRLTKWGGLIR
jgi:hypothetical protein